MIRGQSDLGTSHFHEFLVNAQFHGIRIFQNLSISSDVGEPSTSGIGLHFYLNAHSNFTRTLYTFFWNFPACERSLFDFHLRKTGNFLIVLLCHMYHSLCVKDVDGAASSAGLAQDEAGSTLLPCLMQVASSKIEQHEARGAFV